MRRVSPGSWRAIPHEYRRGPHGSRRTSQADRQMYGPQIPDSCSARPDGTHDDDRGSTIERYDPSAIPRQPRRAPQRRVHYKNLHGPGAR